MNKKVYSPIVLCTIISLSIVLSSCATGIRLRTEKANPAEIKGTYTLILYGGRYPKDIENVAILFKEGQRYTFEVYSADFNYKVREKVPADEALKEAENLVSWYYYASWYYRLSRIVDSAGNTIGYEMRPLYYPLRFGYTDVLDVDYLVKDSKVIINIRLKPEVERIYFDGNRSPRHMMR